MMSTSFSSGIDRLCQTASAASHLAPAHTHPSLAPVAETAPSNLTTAHSLPRPRNTGGAGTHAHAARARIPARFRRPLREGWRRSRAACRRPRRKFRGSDPKAHPRPRSVGRPPPPPPPATLQWSPRNPRLRATRQTWRQYDPPARSNKAPRPLECGSKLKLTCHTHTHTHARARVPKC